MFKRHFLWLIYGIFVALALVFKTDEALFISNGPYALGKPILWLILFTFLGYSFYCHIQEDFFQTMKKTGKYHWTKQIGLDLYIGVGLVAYVIFLNQGALVLALWLIPLLIYANLATLLYLAMNYDSIVSTVVKAAQQSVTSSVTGFQILGIGLD